MFYSTGLDLLGNIYLHLNNAVSGIHIDFGILIERLLSCYKKAAKICDKKLLVTKNWVLG